MAETIFSQVPNGVTFEEVEALPRGEPSLTLQYGSDPLQFGELWLPEASSAARAPLVILIHGGCWLNEFDLTHLHPLATALVESGLAVWSLEYRRIGDDGGGWPGTYEDVIAGINFSSNFDEYAVDPGRVVVIGHSAGGHLASLAAADRDALIASPERIKGSIGLAPIFDIEEYGRGQNDCQAAVSAFITGAPRARREQFLKANPAGRDIEQGSLVLIHGSADDIVPVAQSLDSGQRVRVVDGGEHFDPIHPGTGMWQTAMQEIRRFLGGGIR